VLATIALIGVGSHLPAYVRERAVNTLRDRFDSDVEFGSFHVWLLPHISITGEDLVLRHRHRTDEPPLIRVKRFSATAALRELYRKPTHVRSIHLDGLVITLPPRREEDQVPKTIGSTGERASGNPLDARQSTIANRRSPAAAWPVVVDEIDSDNTELRLMPRDAEKPPKVFLIHQLALRSAGLGVPTSFQAWLTNPRPVGEIETRGRFGPWQKDEPSQTPLAGSYTFTHADLASFRGLAGILASQGTFVGFLDHIEVQGETTTPDFRLNLSGHPVPLRTQFHSVVDGTNGNTLLQPVRAQFLHSSLTADGGVVRTPGSKRRTVFLNVTMNKARLEDLLRLSVKAQTAPMTGLVSMKTKLEIPPGEGEIADRLKLDGEFGVGEALFTRPSVERKLETLSHKGLGEPRAENLSNVVSDLKGTFVLRNGMVTFSNLTFEVPGASVHLEGNYKLHNEELDFRGTLQLKAKLSQTTTGWKSFLLKAADPYFRHKGETVLPIRITGTEKGPQFKLDVGRALRRESE